MTVYNDTVSAYIKELFAAEDEHLRFTREDTLARDLPAIFVKPEEGKFLQLLTRLSGGSKVIEIGTLGGYSSLWIVRALVPGGRLYTLDNNPDHAEIARKHFIKAGVGDQIEIIMGDAHANLRTLESKGPFDMVFIDAEKDGYDDYYEWAVSNVHKGGLIAAHNAFRKGSVAGTTPKDQWTDSQIEFNRKVACDPRVISTIFPAGDGTLVAVRV
jgi:caffeoyl-CoA O-methyltransferase